MINKHYYDKKLFILIVKVLSIILISFSVIPSILKLMLVFGYIMLFRQERWHKHLLIMFVMIIIMSIASGGLNNLIQNK